MSEKQNLKAYTIADPSYFYKILPYTYVLDVSDMWIKKFETIFLSSPSWYYNNTSSKFTASSFGHFVQYTMNSISYNSSVSVGHSSGWWFWW